MPRGLIDIDRLALRLDGIQDMAARDALQEMEGYIREIVLQLETGTNSAFGESVVQDLNVSANASGLAIKGVSTGFPLTVFGGSGSDNGVWKTVATLNDYGSYPNRKFTNKPVFVAGEVTLNLASLNNYSAAYQASFGNGPRMRFRVIQWNSGSTPANKFAESASDFNEVYRGDFFTLGYPAVYRYPLAGLMHSVLDHPSATVGWRLYEVQALWEPRVVTLGTAAVSASGVVITGTNTLWKSQVDPLGISIVRGVTDNIISVDGGPGYNIQQVNSNTSIIITSAYGETTISGADYEITNSRQAPLMQVNGATLSAFEAWVKRF